MAEQSRRDRKRQQTRESIAEAARALFAERGFENVTVAEIAEVADVSEQTVYNHFPSKEELVYWRRGAFEAELLAELRDRPPGESALTTFHRFLTRSRGTSARSDAAQERVDESMHGILGQPALRSQERTIMDSPALRARENSIVAGYTASLAELLADETGAEPGDPEPWVAAAAIMGVHQALITYARGRVLEGAKAPELSRELRVRADRAVSLLAAGLEAYAIKT